MTDGDLLDDYSIVNARLQWNSPEAIWNIELYGKNLTDEIVKTHVFDQVGPVALGTFLPPKTCSQVPPKPAINVLLGLILS